MRERSLHLRIHGSSPGTIPSDLAGQVPIGVADSPLALLPGTQWPWHVTVSDRDHVLEDTGLSYDV